MRDPILRAENIMAQIHEETWDLTDGDRKVCWGIILQHLHEYLYLRVRRFFIKFPGDPIV